MGYLHINNLYKDQTILLFKECYALEKIHGTSAHIGWDNNQVRFFSGGASHNTFKELFDEATLKTAFETLGHKKIIVYGEAHGGKEQGQSYRYGQQLKFVVFDVKIGDNWLSVPQAEEVTKLLGLEFVHYTKVSTDLVVLDGERDAPSEQARRNIRSNYEHREGVVLRPLIELTLNNGERIIAKHKRDEERETTKVRKVVDPSQLEVLTKANDIAVEWVTPTRLEHVLDKIPGANIEQMRQVITAMIEDVLREGAGEIIDSKEARNAISKRTAELFKAKLRLNLENSCKE